MTTVATTAIIVSEASVSRLAVGTTEEKTCMLYSGVAIIRALITPVNRNAVHRAPLRLAKIDLTLPNTTRPLTPGSLRSQRRTAPTTRGPFDDTGPSPPANDHGGRSHPDRGS